MQMQYRYNKETKRIELLCDNGEWTISAHDSATVNELRTYEHMCQDVRPFLLEKFADILKPIGINLEPR